MAIIIVALFMGIGLFTVSVAILAFHHFFDEKITLAVLIFLYIFMTFGIKIPNISQIPFVFIDNYIILHHNFSYQGKLLVTIISMLIIYVVVYVLVKRYWQQQPNLNWKWRRKGIASFYARYLFTRKNILICFSVISVISLWKASNTASFEETSLKDYYLMLFYGHGSNEFHLLSFLEMMIMNSVPLYLLAIYLEEEKQDRNLAITVRLRQKVFWLNAIIGNSMAFIAFYVFCLIMTGSLVGVVFGFEGRATIMALNIALLKFLDISLQFLLMFFLFTFNRNITMAFLGVLAINIMSIWFRYVPTGISSIARGEEMGGLSFAMRLSILLISQLIIWIFIRSVSYKKIFQ